MHLALHLKTGLHVIATESTEINTKPGEILMNWCKGYFCLHFLGFLENNKKITINLSVARSGKLCIFVLTMKVLDADFTPESPGTILLQGL